MTSLNGSLWTLLLASAGIAAVVSSIATLLGQWLERRSRRRELLIAKAIELAKAKGDHARWVIERTGQSGTFYDDIVVAEGYYQWLLHMFDKGKLPEDPRIVRPRSSTDVQ